MNRKRKILSKIPTESILIGILHLIGLLSLYRDADQKRGRPYVYPTTVILRCYVVRIWFRIPSNNALHYFLSIDTVHHRRIIKSCGLHSLPDRRTFDRRFKILPFQCLIPAMGERFESENLADCKIVADDSALIRAKGHVWHHTHIKSNFVPRPGIDTDARWGFARTKGWVFGYKLHMCCSTGKLVVPLSAELSSANTHDTQMYRSMIKSLPRTVRHVVADAGYDDQNLYDFTRQRGARLVCPIKKYQHTKGKRLELIKFYRSRTGQKIYRTRSPSIEPLFQCIKDAFGIPVMPVYGFENARSYVLMCVLVYQLAVYYNCVMNSDEPRCVKRMLGN